MLKYFVSRPFLQLAIIAAIGLKDIVREKLAERKAMHIHDHGEVDGDIIYKNDNGLSVLACTSISLDGNPPQSFEPGHSYLVGLNGNGGSQIDFQLGPVPDNGVNGVTNEALLAIVIHRTKILNGKFPCEENQRAITYMENALALFEQRTKNRKARGVEGKMAV